MSAARPLVNPPDPDTTDHFVYLHGDWDDYERLLTMRGESAVPRITYLEGLIELMSPLATPSAYSAWLSSAARYSSSVTASAYR